MLKKVGTTFLVYSRKNVNPDESNKTINNITINMLRNNESYIKVTRKRCILKRAMLATTYCMLTTLLGVSISTTFLFDYTTIPFFVADFQFRRSKLGYCSIKIVKYLLFDTLADMVLEIICSL